MSTVSSVVDQSRGLRVVRRASYSVDLDYRYTKYIYRDIFGVVPFTIAIRGKRCTTKHRIVPTRRRSQPNATTLETTRELTLRWAHDGGIRACHRKHRRAYTTRVRYFNAGCTEQTHTTTAASPVRQTDGALQPWQAPTGLLPRSNRGLES